MFFLSYKDARCIQCCPQGAPIIELAYTGNHRSFSAEEIFFFSCKPRCTSSRAHLMSTVLLLISGIPHLKPLISVPITIRARLKGKSTSLMPKHINAVAKSKIQVQKIDLPTKQNLVPIAVAQQGTINLLGTFYTNQQVMMDSFCAEKSNAFPQSVMAIKSQSVAYLPIASLIHGPLSFYSISHKYQNN